MSSCVIFVIIYPVYLFAVVRPVVSLAIYQSADVVS